MATIIKSSSCYESDSRHTKHYQQLWSYHNLVSGLMPLTNSYLITILVHMLWHSGELHILAPLALLLCSTLSTRPLKHGLVQHKRCAFRYGWVIAFFSTLFGEVSRVWRTPNPYQCIPYNVSQTNAVQHRELAFTSQRKKIDFRLNITKNKKCHGAWVFMFSLMLNNDLCSPKDSVVTLSVHH